MSTTLRRTLDGPAADWRELFNGRDQAHDPKSVRYFKSVRVRRLP